MRKFFSSAMMLAVLAALTARAEDPAIPLTVTSGFNADIVAEGPGSAGATTSTAFDASFNVFYDNTYDVSHGSYGGGLPSGTTIMDSAGNQYSLAPATGNNALLLGVGGSGTLHLSYADNATLTGLLLLGTSANGNTALDYTLNFAGGVTSSGSVSFCDWYDSCANGTFTSLGRVTQDDDFNTEQGRVFSLTTASIGIAPENAALRLESITLSYGGANVDNEGIFPRAAILGVSAFDPIVAAVPEPATTSLAVCGALALVAGARRKFFKN